jgi:hypothetical protein
MNQAFQNRGDGRIVLLVREMNINLPFFFVAGIHSSR